MDRYSAMLLLVGLSLSMVFMLLALFAVAPIVCSCLVSLLYSLYLFMAYEEAGIHHAQEFENRFWTVFATILTTALLFAKDSPLALGLWSPSLGLFLVILSGYGMHLWDRYQHRKAISKQAGLRLRRNATTNQSLNRLQEMGIPVSDQLDIINARLREIDQLLIPSTINNFVNQRFVLSREREIIRVFEECDARALNYLISHVKLGLLIYKIKDHNYFNGTNRTELINLLAVERLPILTVISRVILLHSLQLLKLRANPRAEDWVRNIILNTHQDDLSELKTLTDAKGDYFCMNKLIYDDIRSASVRQDILNHIRREAAVQQTHMQMGTRRSKKKFDLQWRKVLSDVDDTLCCSGGHYPAGIDKRYPKKAVYPGVLAFYRELDLGTNGPEEWQDDRVGNLVFLSARPHVYRDMSERHNFAKFESLRANRGDSRSGMHTMPSLLAGDLSSGTQYMITDDFEPLAAKKFDNFRRYASIYPEYQHVFVCDNGQGDVRAGEMMFDNFPYEFEALYVHVVQERNRTYGYDLERWRSKEFKPFFFRTYPEAALHAASRNPPMIRIKGLQRICQDAVKDFERIQKWQSESMKALRRRELNQALWRANDFLVWHLEEPVDLIRAEQRWKEGEKVRTPYGIATITGFEPFFDMYSVELDWRPMDVQVKEHEAAVKNGSIKKRASASAPKNAVLLATVVETEDEELLHAMDEKPNTEATTEPLVDRQDKMQEVGEPSAERSRAESLRTRPLGDTSIQPSIYCDESETSSVSNQSTAGGSVADVPSTAQNVTKNDTGVKFRVVATICGLSISAYTPPSLPKLDTKTSRTSLFPFLSKAPESAKKPIFVSGDKWSTPYGPARIVEYREKQKIVVVDMIGWKARAFLQQDSLKRTSKSLFGTFLRQLSGVEGEQKVEFPYAEGTKIETPFGQGVVTRPLRVSPMSSRADRKATNTIGISLVSWKLANGKSPILYSTVDTARLWKENKSSDFSSIFSSTLGTLVTTSRTLLEPFLVPKQSTPEVPKLFKQHYVDAAAVTTVYGDGRVKCFRETDGFYEVLLTRWALTNKKHPIVYLRGDDVSHRISKGCLEGCPVLTDLGLTGTLASVEPTSGVHIVTVPTAGIVCYMQPESIIRPLKAAVGEEVLTPYGDGKVIRYDHRHDIYSILLQWGAKLFAKCDKFDRAADGIQDEKGRFGVDWLLRIFFRSDKSETVSRSRSNSIVSATNSNRSVN